MRRPIGLIVATLVACVTVIVVVPGTASAGLGNITVNITKVVVGDPAPGATFLVRIQCNSTIEADESFDATGGMETVMFSADEPDCSVSEPENGGANSTTFACQPVNQVICDTNTFDLQQGGAIVDITVTNTFVPAPPPAAAAAPVETQPAFTG